MKINDFPDQLSMFSPLHFYTCVCIELSLPLTTFNKADDGGGVGDDDDVVIVVLVMMMMMM